MSDLAGERGAVAAASAAWAGAVIAHPAVGWGAVALVAAAATRHRPRLRAVALVLLLAAVTSTLAARSLAGLAPGVEGPVIRTVVLVSDPEPTGDGRIRADVRVDGRRLWAEARTPLAVRALTPLLAGERIVVHGEVTNWDGGPPEWAIARHLAGRLRIDAVAGVGRGAPHVAAANGLRRLLDRGASDLPVEHRSLLAGLTLGDDREQSPALISDFRASGLTHLLAVSGQNLVFVMAVFGPVLGRLRIWPRFVLASVLVASFAFVTRFEPSVVRAAVVAVVGLWATTVGRPSGGVRHLAIAVTGLLAVDPLLTRSIGFRLSVAACLGVLVLAPRVVVRLPGPRWFRHGLGTTIGAQAAVAPVLVPTFGPMPLAALPANVLAGPLAGALMVWGVGAGPLAGAVGGPVAVALHLPTRVGLALLEAIARLSASLPLGSMDLRHLGALATAAAVGLADVRHPALRRAAARSLVAIVVASTLVVRTPTGGTPAGWAAQVWTDGPVAVVELHAGASAVVVLDTLRSREVGVIGLVVVTSGRSELAAVVDALGERYRIGGVLAPDTYPGRVTVHPAPGDRLHVAGLAVDVDEVEPVVRVRIGWPGEGRR